MILQHVNTKTCHPGWMEKAGVGVNATLALACGVLLARPPSTDTRAAAGPAR